MFGVFKMLNTSEFVNSDNASRHILVDSGLEGQRRMIPRLIYRRQRQKSC